MCKRVDDSMIGKKKSTAKHSWNIYVSLQRLEKLKVDSYFVNITEMNRTFKSQRCNAMTRFVCLRLVLVNIHPPKVIHYNYMYSELTLGTTRLLFAWRTVDFLLPSNKDLIFEIRQIKVIKVDSRTPCVP